MNEDILAQLQKILAKADPSRGATEAEANSAMAMAQRLAIKHNIDLASVAATDAVGAPSFETDRADIDGETETRRLHHAPVAQALMECFDVAFIWRGSGSRCVIIGEKVDVAIAKYCWSWLNATYLELFRQFAKANYNYCGYSERIRRRSYYDGLTHGICTSNARQRKEAAAAPGGDCFSLVIVNKEKAVHDRVAVEFPEMKRRDDTPPKKRRERVFDRTALSHGNQAGLKIKLNNAIAGPNPAQPELSFA